MRLLVVDASKEVYLYVKYPKFYPVARSTLIWYDGVASVELPGVQSVLIVI